MKVFWIAAALAAFALSSNASAAVMSVVSDDLSSDAGITNNTISDFEWASNGTDLILNQPDPSGGGDRASFQNNTVLDLASFTGSAGDVKSITLEFESSIAEVTNGGGPAGNGANRLEVGLVDANTFGDLTEPLGANNDVYGIGYKHTNNFQGSGLAFNDGAGNEQNGVQGVELVGTHTYRLVFTPSGTELFRQDNSMGAFNSLGSLGGTAALDFSGARSYVIYGFGQGSERDNDPNNGDGNPIPRSVNNLLLTAHVVPEPSAVALGVLGIVGVVARRRR